jgi:leucyl/phenylalanyl-tRNA--protein transferase
VRQLARWSISLVDCQVYTPHLASFGATEWPRREFLATLASALERPTRVGPWTLDDDLAAGRDLSASPPEDD